MEESGMCTVPGGLARVKKQFEKDKFAASFNTLSQYQHQHHNRSEQVMRLQVMDKPHTVECSHFSANAESPVWWYIYFHYSLTNIVILRCFRKSSLKHINVLIYLLGAFCHISSEPCWKIFLLSF